MSLPVFVSLFLRFIRPSLYLSVYLPVCVLVCVCLPVRICLCVSVSVCLPVRCIRRRGSTRFLPCIHPMHAGVVPDLLQSEKSSYSAHLWYNTYT